MYLHFFVNKIMSIIFISADQLSAFDIKYYPVHIYIYMCVCVCVCVYVCVCVCVTKNAL